MTNPHNPFYLSPKVLIQSWISLGEEKGFILLVRFTELNICKYGLHCEIFLNTISSKKVGTLIFNAL